MKKQNQDRRGKKTPRLREAPKRADSFRGVTDSFLEFADWKYAGVTLGAAYFVFASLISFHYHKMLDYGMESDFLFEYVPIAKQIPMGSLLIGDYRGPAYPITLAAVKALTGDYFTAGLFIALLASAITIAFTFSLIRRLFNPEIAVCSTLLLMMNAYFFMYSYQVGTDMLFSALITASLYFLLAKQTLSWNCLIVSAALGALAYLTRYNGIFILVVPLLLVSSNHFGLSWRRRLLAGALFTAVFFLCISPWGFYCLKEKGSFFYSANRLNIAFDVYANAQMSREEFFWKGNPFENMSLSALVLYDPRTFFGVLVRNFWEHGIRICQYLLGWPVSILALGGLVLVAGRKIPGNQRSYLLINFAFFLLLLPIHFEIRYPLFLLGCLLSLSVCGLLLWNVNVRSSFRVASIVVFAALLVYSGFRSYEINRRQIDLGPREVLEIANRFRSVNPSQNPRSLVAARKPHIAYYLGLEYLPLPFASSPQALIEQLKQAQVEYLYFGPFEYSTRPELRSLIDASNPVPGLKPVATSVNPLSVLYKIE